jgi:hypothetical protein
MGKISGGYTDISWGSHGGYVQREDPNAFLFSVDQKSIYPVQDKTHSVWHQRDYGPWFGNKGNLGINYGG